MTNVTIDLGKPKLEHTIGSLATGQYFIADHDMTGRNSLFVKAHEHIVSICNPRDTWQHAFEKVRMHFKNIRPVKSIKIICED